MGRPEPGLTLRIAASLVIIGASVFLAVMFDAIKSASDPDVWPNAGMLQWTTIATCNQSLAGGPPETPHPAGTNKSANFFTLHMFLMSLAFGFFGPVASVMYYVLEDTMGLNHDLVKWLHGLVQMGAVIASVLGFMQIFYSAGGWCSFERHFLSLHSYVGIVVLAVYWLQGPLALLIFSNKVLLKPGTAARKLFLKAHVVAGTGLTFLGLVTIMLGILAFEVKKNQWGVFDMPAGSEFREIWFKFVRSGMVAFGLLLLLIFVHSLKPPPAPATGSPINVSHDPLLDGAVKPADADNHAF